MIQDNKKRLFEVFQKVNKINLKEWYDDEYSNHPKQMRGIGGFGNIDWKILHEQLMVNTELLAAHKTSEGNMALISVNEFTDYDGMLSPEELEKLEKFNLITINNGIPMIEDDVYKDYNNFRSKAIEIWDKQIPVNQNNGGHSESPYLRGREEQQD